MESIIQFFMDISGNHITRYGLYIPGEPYKFILWNELLVILLSFAMTILWLKNRALRRQLARERAKTYIPVHKPAPALHEHLNARKPILSSTIEKIIGNHEFIWIKYIDFNGNVTERTIEFCVIYPQDGHWYIAGFCQMRRETRTFRVDRIIEIKPGEADEDEAPLPEHPGEDVAADDIPWSHV